MDTRNTLRTSLAILAVAGLLLAAGCPKGEGTKTGPRGRPVIAVEKTKVVCTTGMITDLAERIGGDRVEVTGMMGPGVDPHLYKARESDVTALHEAEVVIYNGLHLEARLADLLEQLHGHKTVVGVAENLHPDQLLYLEGGEGMPDPHIWFDVELFKQAVTVITTGIASVDQNNMAYYSSNAEELLAEMDELHEYVTAQAALVPEDKRVLITAHDAFNYFGRAYGFEVVGLQGISTAAEAGTADVKGLVDLVVEHKIPAVFIESSVPERNIKAVQEAVAARGHSVEIGGELYSDALGDAGTEAGTYLGMVRHNIDTIVAALAPEAVQPGAAGEGEITAEEANDE